MQLTIKVGTSYRALEGAEIKSTHTNKEETYQKNILTKVTREELTRRI